MSEQDGTVGAIPQHVAIIMDGNNRWAKRRGLPGAAGHKAGVERLRQVLDACKTAGVQTVTVFAFSTENWQRPTLEVKALMSLFSSYLKSEARKLHEEGVALRVIGDKTRFSVGLQRQIEEAQRIAHSGDTTLVIAADYGGRWDVVQAARQLGEQCRQGVLNPADISEEHVTSLLCLGDLPPVDLLIRTGGEMRISNFLLWQCAYAELYFTDALWPDFDRRCLLQALTEFSRRQRRFGLSGEQVVGPDYA